MGHGIHFSGAADTQQWGLTPSESRHSAFLFGAQKNQGYTLPSLLGCTEGLVLPSYRIPPLWLSLSVSASLCHCDRVSLQSSGWPGTCTGYPLCLLCSLTTFLISVSPILLSRLDTQQKSRSRKTILCSKVCDLVSDSLRAQRWASGGVCQD